MNRRIARKIRDNFIRGIVRETLKRKFYLPPDHLVNKAYSLLRKRQYKQK